MMTDSNSTENNEFSSHDGDTHSLLKAMGASSWYDAFMCVFTYFFVGTLIFAFLAVTVTFVGSLFSGLKNATGL